MRMLMKIVLPTAAYNRAIQRGDLGPSWKKVFDLCPPEAVYYVGENGQRAVYAFVAMEAAEQVAAVSLPLFEAFEAEVTLTPAMVFADIEAGIRLVS
jgi:hypothetical protein